MGYYECCHYCVAPKRYPGCSDKCPEYKEAKAKHEADKARERERISPIRYHANMVAEKRDSAAKYKKRRPKKVQYW